MLQLKTYQQQALDVLEQFLLASREQPLPVAFRASLNAQQRDEIDYQPLFGATPCVCLRIPTGGGKTLLAAHLIALASAARSDNPAPVALWLTPSDTIRRQTLEALSDVRHPYRQALAQHFGAELRICDLDELATINTHDVGKSAIIIVATIQAFNITDTKQRNVYAFDENLAAHFAQLPTHGATALECVTAADLTAQPFLTANDIGRIKYSIANWLHLQQPLIIVDEAHIVDPPQNDC
ncbi:DEAD/DEAH box helicase family protein [Chromatium okenii]|uniref:DEAD/DEAH box helicase family protein n=1 Tax=Chromatium okenii TaxID=61644 RepID=UPI001904F111|nr:DEAD/DEAH box helicase family protein [Chromatium okenii]